MPHETLHNPRRNASLIGQRRHLAPQAVEVEEQPGTIPVGNAGNRQVGLKHLRALAFRQREDGLASGQRSHVGGQIARQIVRHGQDGILAVLGVGSGHGDAGSLPVERVGLDAGDLRVTQAGRHGQPIAQGSNRSCNPENHGASLGNPDERLQFIEGDGPAVVPTIFLGVEPLDPSENMLPGPVGVMAPFGESADRGAVMVAGLERKPSVLQLTDRSLDLFGREMGQPGRCDDLNDLPEKPGPILWP